MEQSSQKLPELLPADYQQRITEIAPGEWCHFAKRTEIPPLPVWEKMLALGSPEFEQLYGTAIPGLAYWDHPFGTFYLHSEEYRRVMETITQRLFSADVGMQVKKTSSLCESAKRAAKAFREEDIREWHDVKLLKHYDELITCYNHAFLYGFITWCTHIPQQVAMEALRQRQNTLIGLGVDENTAFAILVAHPKPSLYVEKAAALSKLARRHRAALVKLGSRDAVLIEQKMPTLHRATQKFLRQYGWLGYDYGGPEMSYAEAVEMLLEGKETTETQMPKSTLIAACHFSGAEQKLFETFALLSYVKDVRNTADDYVHWCLDMFYAEVGRRHGFTATEVRHLWPEELRKLLSGKAQYTKAYLQQKMQYCFIHMLDSQGPVGAHGEEARALVKAMFGKEHGEPTDESAITGTPAASGKVRGTVRIVHIPADMGNVQEGDILVTHMTSPRFMAAIQRCGAIVTDEGGLTCHAAIIARELQKPCVVGTRRATKILKDGDMIEVDAEKGIVRRIV